MQKLPTRIAHNEAVCQCHDLMRCEGGQLAWLNLRARRICTQGFIILCLFWRPSFYIAQVQASPPRGGAPFQIRSSSLTMPCRKGFLFELPQIPRPQLQSNHVTYGSHTFREGCMGRPRDLTISRNLFSFFHSTTPTYKCRLMSKFDIGAAAAVMRCVSPFLESGIAKRVDSQPGEQAEVDSQK